MTERFFAEGLFFSPAEAKQLADFLSGRCFQAGGIAGAGTAFAVSRDVAGRGGDGRYSAAAVAAAFVVGAGAGYLGCMALRSKLLEYFRACGDDVQKAISALTPEKRSDLRNEAQRILDMVVEPSPAQTGPIA